MRERIDYDGMAHYTFMDVSKKRAETMTNLAIRTFKLSFVERKNMDEPQLFSFGELLLSMAWDSYQFDVSARQADANALAKEIAMFLFNKYGSKDDLTNKPIISRDKDEYMSLFKKE